MLLPRFVLAALAAVACIDRLAGSRLFKSVTKAYNSFVCAQHCQFGTHHGMLCHMLLSRQASVAVQWVSRRPSVLSTPRRSSRKSSCLMWAWASTRRPAKPSSLATWCTGASRAHVATHCLSVLTLLNAAYIFEVKLAKLSCLKPSLVLPCPCPALPQEGCWRSLC